MPDRKPPFGAEAPGPIPRHSRTYAFVVDDGGRPIEVGADRFTRVFLGEERRVESETGLRRPVVIKMLAKGVGDDEAMRFRSEQQLLARGPRDSLLRELEQEANVLERLVNVQQGSPEIGYFYIDVGKNDSFALFNRPQEYSVLYKDRARSASS